MIDPSTFLSAGALLTASVLGVVQEVRNKRAAVDTLRSADTGQAITGLSLAEQAQRNVAHDCLQRCEALEVENNQLRSDLDAALERIDQLEARP